MKSVEIIKTWFEPLTKPEKTIKKLEKKKMKTVDGFKSVALLALIATVLGGGLLLIASGFTSAVEIIKELITLFILVTLTGIIGLYVFSYLFTRIMKKHKGKAKIEKITAIYGLFIGTIIISLIPYFLGYGLMSLFSSSPLISYFFLGAGLLATTAYSGRATGYLFELLAKIEKVEVNKVGWVQGAATGTLYFILLLLTGIFMQLL